MSIGGPMLAGYLGPWVGRHRIADTISRLGAPGSYRATLFERKSARAIRTQISGSNGEYAFEWIPYLESGYFVVAFDHTEGDQRNAAIADLITPEPMP